MTQVADFDIATDLKVEFFLPDAAGNLFILGVSLLGSDDVLAGANQFILGTSLLGGTDVLAGEDVIAFTWQNLETYAYRADINVGGSIQDALYFQPQAGQATIGLKTYLFDPNVNGSMRPGTKVRVRVDDGVIDETLFTGYIDSVDVQYYIEGVNQITIKATDIWKRIVNSRIAEYSTEGIHDGYATPSEVFEEVAAELGLTISPDSETIVGKIPAVTKTDVIPNTFLNEALQVGLGISWIDPATEDIVLVNRPATITPTGTEFVIGNDHPATPADNPYHLCMSDIAVTSDSDTVFNSLRVELASDADVYIVNENIDSIQLYGTFAKDVTLNTTNYGQLEAWSNRVFNKHPTRLVQSIETPAVDRYGTLTDAAFFTPGTVVGVKYAQNALSLNEYYTIIKVSHSITPKHWSTNLELWKEF